MKPDILRPPDASGANPEKEKTKDIKILSMKDERDLKEFFRKMKQEEATKRFFNAHPLDDDWAEKICRKAKPDEWLNFVHAAEEKIDGYAYVYGLDDQDPDNDVFVGVFVDPEKRKAGIAKGLVNFAIQKAQEAGKNKIYAAISKENEPSKNLFTKIGFKIAGETTNKKSFVYSLDLRGANS